LLCLSVAPSLIAQVRPVGFPHSSVAGNWGSYIPLGEECHGNAVEARTQILIPAEYLPPRPSVLRALEHLPAPINVNAPAPNNCPAGLTTVTYSQLEITIAHRPHGAGALSTTFANNLGGSAQVVLPTSPTPVTITWVPWTWNSIWFQTPFNYNGTDDLVIEIKKVVVPSSQNVGTVRNQNDPRANLPQQLSAWGPAASGRNNWATGNLIDLLGWQLRFDSSPEPTLTVHSTLGTNGKSFDATSACQFGMHGTVGNLYVIAANFAPFLPTAITLPPASGGIWLDVASPSITWFLGGITSTPKFDAFTLPPGFSGLVVRCQGGEFDPATSQLTMTNAVDFQLY